MSAASSNSTEKSFVAARIDQVIDEQLERKISSAIEEAVARQMHVAISARIEKQVAKHVGVQILEEAKPSRIYRFEHFFEDKILFGSRWILAPSYFMLVLVLIALCYKTGEEFVQLIIQFKPFDENSAIIQALVIVDLVLVMNLVLMIMFVGYINFVSKIHPSRGEDWPDWTQHLDYSGLKLQLLGSITAISAIVLLREILRLLQQDVPVNSTRIIMMVVIHLTFVVSALIVAVVNKIKANEVRERQTPIA